MVTSWTLAAIHQPRILVHANVCLVAEVLGVSLLGGMGLQVRFLFQVLVLDGAEI